jgi:integrase/recombinase XerC
LKHKDLIRSFSNGEAHCMLCGVPLPTHDTWPGKRTHTCEGLACVDDLDVLSSRLKTLVPGSALVRPNAEICCGPKCGRLVAAGIYGSRWEERCCSADCWYRKDANPTAVYVCACGCGRTFRGNRSASRRRGTAFFNFNHRSRFLLEANISACGDLANVVREFLNTFVPSHYRNSKNAQSCIFPFFKWCAKNGIKQLLEIRPKTITKYLSSCRQSGRKTPHYRVSALATFFSWAIAEERYLFGNPVVNLIHAQRRSSPAPRPLADGELVLMWNRLEMKNDPRLLFAASIAEESGLRIGEVCNLRLSDVDVAGQQVFVRLPNKSNKERYSLFGTRTAGYFRRVLSVRPNNLKHDHLLWNAVAAPMQISSLRRSLRLALCKTYQGKVANEVGFDRWSTHRLRHNMATSMRRGGADVAALMAIGGWQSMDAAGAYIEITGDDSKREYEAAMERARKDRSACQIVESVTLTPLQLLERNAPANEVEHCA